LTIAAMIWVNDLAGIRDIPLWLKHAPVPADAMTFPDIVFPLFLFLVGMSIPLALGRRLDRGESLVRVLWHVASRTLGLLAIGVLMVNMPAVNADATGLTRPQWSLLAFVGAILTWNAYPRSQDWRRLVFVGLRFIGIGLLIWLVVIYRGKADGQVTWLRTQWWGILGLIGWAYLTASCCYLWLRKQPAALVGAWAFMMALCIAEHNGALGQFKVARAISDYVALGTHIGGHSAIVLAGVLAVLLPAIVRSGRAAFSVRWLLVATLVLLVAGAILRAPYGLSKNRVTPSWCLYCPAIGCAAFAVLHWLIDRRGVRLGTRLIRAAGNNALLGYLLPSVVGCALAVMHWDPMGGELAKGTLGIIRSSVFTAVMICLVAALGRLGVRLRL
jgi:predicted acyltransferase